jgi:hypothetical protein
MARKINNYFFWFHPMFIGNLQNIIEAYKHFIQISFKKSDRLNRLPVKKSYISSNLSNALAMSGKNVKGKQSNIINTDCICHRLWQ